MKIAKNNVFSGPPVITTPTVIGGSPRKEIQYRITAIGSRPLEITVTGLPDGLTFDGTCIRGTSRFGGCFFFNVTAKNKDGAAEKKIRLELFQGNIQRTPLLGFTTWNAFTTKVTKEDLLRTADCLERSGLADCGYQYINLDSSWQGDYGGEFDAIQPCSRFPDIADMIRDIHSRGFLFGIYSSPFLEPWGKPQGEKPLKGCTLGDPDPAFPPNNAGIGMIRKESNNVKQWTAWGVDYLKYDWAPTDPVNAQKMREALNNSSKDFVYCCTVAADPQDGEFWLKTANSWRGHTDSYGNWDNLKKIADSYLPWQKYVGYGHYYDLDMLDIGVMDLFECKLTDNEKIFAFTLRAMLASPIQLSCDLTKATEFEFDLYTNEEVIAINQDGLLAPAHLIEQDGDLRIYEKELEDGGTAVCVFNGSDAERFVSIKTYSKAVRDVWLKEDLGCHENITKTLEPHSVWLIRY